MNKRAPLTRFLKYVRVVPCGGCWEWTGSLTPKGYSRFSVNGRLVSTHRWAYETWVGPIPAGLELDHLCRNRACVNPAHLEPVSHKENSMRGNTVPARNAAVTHCPYGHEYVGDNVYINPRGSRECRSCQRRRGREYYYRQAELARLRSLARSVGVN